MIKVHVGKQKDLYSFITVVYFWIMHRNNSTRTFIVLFIYFSAHNKMATLIWIFEIRSIVFIAVSTLSEVELQVIYL